MISTKRCPGVDFTIDLKRLAASVAVAAEAANYLEERALELAAATVTAYRERMFALADLSPLEIWHSLVDLEHELKVIRKVEMASIASRQSSPKRKKGRSR